MVGAAAAVTVAAVALLLRARAFRVLVAGDSMRPSLAPGDRLVACGGFRPRSGSLIVLGDPRDPSFELVKRVVGLPGDVTPGDGRILGQREYWVEGDRGAASTDSRAFGPVGVALVRGVVVARYRPRPRWLTGRRARAPRR